jgi:hypothetical protein
LILVQVLPRETLLIVLNESILRESPHFLSFQVRDRKLMKLVDGKGMGDDHVMFLKVVDMCRSIFVSPALF